MSDLPYVNRFSELIVYQKTLKLADVVFDLTKEFPNEERFSLTDQIRRSSRAVGSQIAEAWAKRRYPKHFASKLTDADGEQLETQHWLQIAKNCGYIDESTLKETCALCLEVGKMLGAMIRRADEFGGNSSKVTEETVPYLTGADRPD